ncbi:MULTISPECIES: hypothetical protein [unclassified Pseudomonas]|uniref:hypothetical protein n=1 Tax=Pseudomonas TaxID=286 RepID=UPI000C88C6EF|nr:MULTISPECIES: hypothetical protein [unclassified Pseudomonas]PNA04779.1 hypothetical protein C1X28_14465 [Pseudomonas sp. FW305-BF15]PNB79937.1 hypothetical protein C1X30_15150 [Pseudomonas sp. FW305-BF6]
MFKSSKSLVLAISLFSGLALADLASASSQPLVAEYGSENLQKDRVAEGGADRLQELRERVAEGGADRLQELRERVAGGADRLQELRERVAEGGADRLQELRERVAEGGADRLQELRERSARSVLVAENRPEFGSKYQRY